MDSGKSPEKLAVLVVGTDTLIEALPARPIQLAHACGAFGFDLAVPLSWGDELVAESALSHLERRSTVASVLCICPLARRRLLRSGPDLSSALVSLQAPPVALARYLRTELGPALGTLAFVGRCPDATKTDYDTVYQPDEFLSLIRSKGIQVLQQPDVFYDRLPPDRRRFASLPGGCPSPDALWQRCNGMSLVELEGGDFALELAQHLLAGTPALVDPALVAGCHCAGLTPSTTPQSARVAVSSLEPPRATSPVVASPIPLERELPEQGLVSPAASGPMRTRRAPMAVTPPTAFRIRT